MELFTLFAIAIGLSFDTFAASLSCGLVKTRISFWQSLRVAFIMALFQGGMPLAGYYLGVSFKDIVEPIDHWMAFGFLFLLGSRMVYFGLKNEKSGKGRDLTKMSILVLMSIGTSIDAFVVGISLGFLDANIWTSALIIGIITFLASMLAIRLGKGIGDRFGKNVEIAGGIILILIGIKILIEHTF